MKKQLVILLSSLILSGTLCQAQMTRETWRKIETPFADFVLPDKDLRISGEDETVSTSDSLMYAGFFHEMKIGRKLTYKASGDKIRCSITVYSGSINTDNREMNSNHLMESCKKEFESPIFQIKKEEIKRVKDDWRLTLSLIPESKMGVINLVIWIGDNYVVVIASEGLESEIEYLHSNFKLNPY